MRITKMRRRFDTSSNLLDFVNKDEVNASALSSYQAIKPSTSMLYELD